MFGNFNIKSAIILEATTSATGTDYVEFIDDDAPSNGYIAMDIVNNSGTDIEYRRGGSGKSITVPDGSSRLVLGVGRASDISIKRADGSATQVTVTAEAFSP